ncbi:hypothetical protein VNO80_11456 [Phaseolus coccineus]|uniref:glucan endo-1,3-beta-D-glucosidase n=1 Tax=Phaseolus coccineus TaxID=3886 RepID=A0AAN9NA80_PHACN
MWAFCMILAMALCHLQGGQGEGQGGQGEVQGGQGKALPDIGVNWGAIASHPLDPPIVVNLLKENGISRIKLFDADPWTVSAFSGSDIEVMVGIPNEMLKKLAKHKDDAEDWVKHNVSKQVKGGVNIRYISVGNEPFLKSYNNSFVGTTLPAMKNVQRALSKAGFGDQIKVTTALNADVYESATDKPSDGNFRKDIADLMKEIVAFLEENKAPFLVNIYPFLSLYQNDGFPKDYAFFDGNAKGTDDKNTHYSNMFDANLDTLVWSLKKVGHPNVTIVIGEVGWPTDGDKSATIENAKRFYQGYLKKMANKKGSPLHPQTVVTYLFSLTDEDQKSVAPGDFERHWGIFSYDGRPKFSIDFSGKGQDKMPVAAKGVIYQQKQWCVLKRNISKKNLQTSFSYACLNGDCTSLGPNRSCSSLDAAGNASYAFNQYFQISDQSVEACDFDGLAHIVTENPSTPTCNFTIAILSTGNILKATPHLKGFLIGFILIFTFFL